MTSIQSIKDIFKKEAVTMGFTKDSGPSKVELSGDMVRTDKALTGVLKNLNLLVKIGEKSTGLIREVSEVLPTGALIAPGKVECSIPSLYDEDNPEVWNGFKEAVMIGIISSSPKYEAHADLIVLCKRQDKGFVGRQFESDGFTLRKPNDEGKGGASQDFINLYGVDGDNEKPEGFQIGHVALQNMCAAAMGDAMSRITKQRNKLLLVDPVAIEFRKNEKAQKAANRAAQPTKLDHQRLQDIVTELSNKVTKVRQSTVGKETPREVFMRIDELISEIEKEIVQVMS
jgi:hypothetical protein